MNLKIQLVLTDHFMGNGQFVIHRIVRICTVLQCTHTTNHCSCNYYLCNLSQDLPDVMEGRSQYQNKGTFFAKIELKGHIDYVSNDESAPTSKWRKWQRTV